MSASIRSLLESVLRGFRGCFGRTAAWVWFVLLVLGFMVRSDQLGMTSVIRDLALAPHVYETMMHFFRATSWNLELLRACWRTIISRLALIREEESDRCVLVGDGVKQPKEGRRMTGVKKLHQESEDS